MPLQVVAQIKYQPSRGGHKGWHFYAWQAAETTAIESKQISSLVSRNSVVSSVMANDNDEVIQLYKDPIKAFAHVFLLSTNQQVEEIGRMWQRMKQQRKDDKLAKRKPFFTIEGLIEFLYSERFEEYAQLFDQDPKRMRSRFFAKLAGEEKECLKRGKVGRIVYQSGYRKIGDKLFIQSWCLSCRNKG